MKIKVGLYGTNGHQIHQELVNHPHAELVAVASFERDALPEPLRESEAVQNYGSLAALLQDEDVQLVSLCSPRRRDQTREAIQCLKAGKHVYAEKPCAMTEEDLNTLIQIARDTGMRFHEMAGTLYAQPFYAMRDIVSSGKIGTVVQVLAQKSYPMHDSRPQDEDVDGGLVCQAGVHAARFIEHVAGLKIVEIETVETCLGNPRPEGALRVAASYMGTLENGGVFSMLANYLNPKGFGSWGNETLRIFGTEGMLESVDGGACTRLVVGEENLGEIDTSGKVEDYFDLYVRSLLGQVKMPFTMEDELHPTRMVIRAKADADRR